MKLYRVLAICVVSLFGLGMLAACAGAPQDPAAQTLVPTIDVQNAPPTEGQPPAGQQGEYPAPPPDTRAGEVPPAVEGAPGIEGAYPADPGPQGVPAVENRSRVTARLVEQSPSVENPTQTRLRALILTSEDEAGMQNFTRDLVDQEVDLFIETPLLPADLAPGDTFEAQVSYRGDEQGGIYLAETITEIAQ